MTFDEALLKALQEHFGDKLFEARMSGLAQVFEKGFRAAWRD